MVLSTFFYMQASSKTSKFCLRCFFFLLYSFGFVKKQVCIGVWIYFWFFDSIPLINLSVFMPISCCFYYWGWWYLKMFIYCTRLLQLFQIFLFFHTTLSIVLSRSVKKLWLNFNENCVESVDWFWQDSHFYCVNLTDLWAWEILLCSDIFFNFWIYEGDSDS